MERGRAGEEGGRAKHREAARRGGGCGCSVDLARTPRPRPPPARPHPFTPPWGGLMAPPPPPLSPCLSPARRRGAHPLVCPLLTKSSPPPFFSPFPQAAKNLTTIIAQKNATLVSAIARKNATLSAVAANVQKKVSFAFLGRRHHRPPLQVKTLAPSHRRAHGGWPASCCDLRVARGLKPLAQTL